MLKALREKLRYDLDVRTRAETTFRPRNVAHSSVIFLSLVSTADVSLQVWDRLKDKWLLYYLYHRFGLERLRSRKPKGNRKFRNHINNFWKQILYIFNYNIIERKIVPVSHWDAWADRKKLKYSEIYFPGLISLISGFLSALRLCLNYFMSGASRIFEGIVA